MADVYFNGLELEVGYNVVRHIILDDISDKINEAVAAYNETIDGSVKEMFYQGLNVGLHFARAIVIAAFDSKEADSDDNDDDDHTSSN